VTIKSKLDIMHRRHLKQLANIHGNHRISNADLYKKCGCYPISIDVGKARWNLLGHVLRMDKTSPAQMSLEVAVSKKLKGSVGRPRACLLTSIREDVKQHLGMDLKNLKVLEALRRIATNKSKWSQPSRIRRP